MSGSFKLLEKLRSPASHSNPAPGKGMYIPAKPHQAQHPRLPFFYRTSLVPRRNRASTPPTSIHPLRPQYSSEYPTTGQVTRPTPSGQVTRPTSTGQGTRPREQQKHSSPLPPSSASSPAVVSEPSPRRKDFAPGVSRSP